ALGHRIGGSLAGQAEERRVPDLDGGFVRAGLRHLGADRDHSGDEGLAGGGLAVLVESDVAKELRVRVRLVQVCLAGGGNVGRVDGGDDLAPPVRVEHLRRAQRDGVVGGGTLCPLRIVREPRRDPARLPVHRLLPRGGCRRRLGGVGLRGAGGRAVSAAVREGDGGDEEDHHADHRDQAAGRRAAGSARAAVRTAALALGQAGPGLARATVALGGLVLVSETHAAYAPSTSSGNTSYSVYSSYDGSRAGPRAGAVW